MIPRTDKERILQLEARNAELESELAEYRRQEVIVRAPADTLDAIRRVLRGAYIAAGGPMIAMMFNELLISSPRPASRDHMFVLTRTHNSWAADDGALKSVDVQICKLRKALAILGHPDIIKTVNGRGWMIAPADRDSFKASFGL